MKIYVNELHQIKAVHKNNTVLELKEIEIPDNTFNGYCEIMIKAYCYQEHKNEIGEIIGTSIYPYKDLSLIESLEEINRLQEQKQAELEQFIIEQEYRTSLIELQM